MSGAPQPSTVQRALSGHAAIGLIAGALLYIVCLTGTVAVFYPELQRWEQPRAPTTTHVTPAAVQRMLETTLAREHDKPRTKYLFLQLPTDDLPRLAITTDHEVLVAHADGTLVGPKQVAWSDFLVALHYQLNVPGMIGALLVGGLGVMILVLAISGVIAHPRIFRDAFRLRTRDIGGLALSDWHNRLSVWTLPFSTAVALTGAVIALGTLGAWAIGAVYEKGNAAAVYAPLFGRDAKLDPRTAGPPDVAAALATMATRFPGASTSYILVDAPFTAGQVVEINATLPRRLVYGENYKFDGQGRFLGKAGLSDGAAGQQVTASLYDLHFGNFGGLPVKIAYFVFGAALTAICGTGMSIWLGKRQRRGYHEPRLYKAWDAAIWGTPAALALTLVLRFTVGNAAPFAATFWIASAAALAAAFTPVSPRCYRRISQALLVVLLLAAVALEALNA